MPDETRDLMLDWTPEPKRASIMPRAWAVVPAAGCGERFGDDCPKQFSIVQGHTLLSYTIAGLLVCEDIEKVIVVTSDHDRVGKLPLWWSCEESVLENWNFSVHNECTGYAIARTDTTGQVEKLDKIGSGKGALLQTHESTKCIQEICGLTDMPSGKIPLMESVPVVKGDETNCKNSIGNSVTGNVLPARDFGKNVNQVEPLGEVSRANSETVSEADDATSQDASGVRTSPIGTPAGAFGPSAEQRVHFVAGSTSRHRSIKCGLDALAQFGPPPDVVLVHDGVRPLVPAGLVSALVRAAGRQGAAGLTRPLVSTVVAAEPGGLLAAGLDRSRHRASETPQAFAFPVIARAYRQCTDHELDHGTECLQLVLDHCGVRARLLEGSPDLWKVTYRRDLHAFRGVVNDRHLRVALLSDADLEDLQRLLLRRLAAAVPGVAPVPAAGLAPLGGRFCSAVLLQRSGRPPPAEVALGLDRRRPGYLVQVTVTAADAPAPDDGDPASAARCLRDAGKWLCRVALAGRPADDGRCLAALLAAVLTSEEGAFHGQLLRV